MRGNWLKLGLFLVLGILCAATLSSCGAVPIPPPDYEFHPTTSMTRIGGPTGVLLPPVAADVHVNRVANEWSCIQVVVTDTGKDTLAATASGEYEISILLQPGVRAPGSVHYGESDRQQAWRMPQVYQVLAVNYAGPAKDKTFQVPLGQEGPTPDVCVPVSSLTQSGPCVLHVQKGVPTTLLLAFPPEEVSETWKLSLYPYDCYDTVDPQHPNPPPSILQISLSTYPFVKLPERFDFTTATTWDWQIKDYTGRPLTADERLDFLNFFLDYRITPAMFFGKGANFTDAEIKLIASRGGSMFQVYHIGGGGAKELNDKQKANAAKDLAACRKTMEALGVADRCYALVADEPPDDAAEGIRKNAAFLKEQWPALKIWVGSRPVPELMDVVDVWDVVTAGSTAMYARHSHTDEAYKLARAAQTHPAYWWFWSVEPYRPEPNCLINNDLIDCRALGWQSFAQGVDGFEYFWATDWAANKKLATVAYPQKAEQWDPGLSGAGQLCYPMEVKVNGVDRLYPVPSLRLINLRDAFEDWQLFRMAGDGLKAQFPHPDLKSPETLEKMRWTAEQMIGKKQAAPAPARSPAPAPATVPVP